MGAVRWDTHGMVQVGKLAWLVQLVHLVGSGQACNGFECCSACS